ncbi:GL21878 [Drosophila persimilis]|uniref:MICOS complex subunit MIC10 n=1 Tax=Drosophila persimilis TaxID=7234 RepID=B4GE71_DROPE|nr:GL21878 [Drosophila persimilis]
MSHLTCRSASNKYLCGCIIEYLLKFHIGEIREEGVQLIYNTHTCIHKIHFSGGGLIIGSAVSLLFFRRRAWPAWLGTGFGIGVAYRTCEKDLNSLK